MTPNGPVASGKRTQITAQRTGANGQTPVVRPLSIHFRPKFGPEMRWRGPKRVPSVSSEAPHVGRPTTSCGHSKCAHLLRARLAVGRSTVCPSFLMQACSRGGSSTPTDGPHLAMPASSPATRNPSIWTRRGTPFQWYRARRGRIARRFAGGASSSRRTSA